MLPSNVFRTKKKKEKSLTSDIMCFIFWEIKLLFFFFNLVSILHKTVLRDFFGSPSDEDPVLPRQGVRELDPTYHNSEFKMQRLKILSAATKTWYSQINTFLKKDP